MISTNSRLSPYYRLEDVADVLKVSRYTVETWFTKGDLSGKQVGNSWQTTPQQFNEFFLRTNVSPRFSMLRAHDGIEVDLT